MKTQLTALSFLAAILLSQSLIHAEEQNEGGKRMYQTYCTGCHGSSGRGDGPAAKTLPVRPADHTRVEMKKHSDQYLFDIISQGRRQRRQIRADARLGRDDQRAANFRNCWLHSRFVETGGR